jgi:2-polyprenyl-3-methyl-5-hydroxy-6-metoxy-1,4-benzoquinol methylase
MHRQGWSVTGLDVSAAAVATVERKLGVPALLGSLPHPDLERGSFDVITMWHSLEHVHHPLPILQAARELLAPGGKILVAVPNFAGLPFEWFGPSWFALDLPRHLVHFTPNTLIAMLAKAGFASIKIRMIRHDDWLRSSARLACRKSNPPGWQKMLTHKYPARMAAWACYLLGRSDCMLATATV